MQKPQEFKQLTKEQKIIKIIGILEVLKGDKELFDDIYELVSTLQNEIEEELLNSIYTNIYSAVSNLNNSKLKKDIDKMEKIRQRLKKLKELEEKEKNKPDEILDKLESI